MGLVYPQAGGLLWPWMNLLGRKQELDIRYQQAATFLENAARFVGGYEDTVWVFLLHRCLTTETDDVSAHIKY